MRRRGIADPTTDRHSTDRLAGARQTRRTRVSASLEVRKARAWNAGCSIATEVKVPLRCVPVPWMSLSPMAVRFGQNDRQVLGTGVSQSTSR